MLRILSKVSCGSIPQGETNNVEVAQHGCLVYRNVEFKKMYEIKGLLGVPGTFGEVRSCINKKSGEKLAVKIIKNLNCLQDLIRNECDIVQRLSHDSCASTKAVFFCKKKICIVMPAYHGGDLFDKVVSSGGVLQESQAKQLMVKLLHGVQYLHGLRIAHCDIKLSNILFTAKGDLKLIDFGVSQIIGGEESMLHKEVGSPSFIAPEVLMGSYNEICDMWSVGVVAFIMICGFNPFNPRALPALRFRQKICESVLKGFTPEERSGYGAFFPKVRPVSQDAKDFISHLLTSDWRHRMTASEALNHPWLVDNDTKTSSLE